MKCNVENKINTHERRRRGRRGRRAAPHLALRRTLAALQVTNDYVYDGTDGGDEEREAEHGGMRAACKDERAAECDVPGRGGVSKI